MRLDDTVLRVPDPFTVGEFASLFRHDPLHVSTALRLLRRRGLAALVDSRGRRWRVVFPDRRAGLLLLHAVARRAGRRARTRRRR